MGYAMLNNAQLIHTVNKLTVAKHYCTCMTDWCRNISDVWQCA